MSEDNGREQLFREMSSPDFEDEVREIRQEYRKAIDDIQRELDQLDVSEVHKRSYTEPTRKKIKNRIKRLEEFIESKAYEKIEKAGRRGIAHTLIGLGIAGNFNEAYQKMDVRRLNQNVIAGNQEDLFDDLLQVTQNMDRKSKRAIRQAAAKASRDMTDQGFTGRRVISEKTAKEIRSVLKEPGRSGIVDNAGRRWKPDVYADMVTRTKMMDTHSETVMNEAVQRDALYGVISSHGAPDPCRFHEGRIIKLTDNAPGNYPTYEELRGTGQVFHPNCRHVVSPIRDLDNLPQDIRQKAEKQGDLGRKAVQTGKRYPEVDGIKPER